MGRPRRSNPRLCEMPGCTDKHYAKGQCKLHYFRSWRRKEHKSNAREEEEALKKMLYLSPLSPD